MAGVEVAKPFARGRAGVDGAGQNNAPVTILSNQNFGRIMAAGEPRVLQFGVKYQF